MDAVFAREIQRKHETVFSVFLIALAFLFRRDPTIVYPHLLIVLTIFMAFNFLYNRYLKEKTQSSKLAYSPVFVNGILITWALHYSGGSTSYLWVMYLLPIFTACLLLDQRGLWLTTAYVIFLQLSVFGEKIWALDAADVLQLFSRVGLLVLSASVTSRLAYEERNSRENLAKQREEFEKTLKHKDESPGLPKPAPTDSLLSSGIHDLNTVLTIILGSAQIVQSQSGQDWFGRDDLRRLESATRLGKLILQNLYLLERREEWTPERVSLKPILEDVVNQCRVEAKSRGVFINESYLPEECGLSINRHLLMQILLNVMFQAVLSTPEGEKVNVTISLGYSAQKTVSYHVLVEYGGRPLPKELMDRFFDPTLITPERSKGVGLALYLSREAVLKSGGEITASSIMGVGNRIALMWPAA